MEKSTETGIRGNTWIIMKSMTGCTGKYRSLLIFLKELHRHVRFDIVYSIPGTIYINDLIISVEAAK